VDGFCENNNVTPDITKARGHLKRNLGAQQEGVLSSRVKRPGNETDHSPPFSAEVKNGSVIPPLHIRLHGRALN
jgi:hypothetical protein